jgi:choline dehydrogenase-like flavoprotein
VHGRHGTDPTEPHASAEYKYAPVAHEPRIQEFADDLSRLGHHPFPLPLGLLLEESNGVPVRTSRCIKCSAFDGFPCPLLAKADAEVICVAPALTHANVTLLTRAHVDRLETSSSGREVTTVHVTREGKREQFAANIVVIACGAINSAGLLLRSTSDRHPRGLANGSDVVGRHYMRHNNSVLMAVSRRSNPTMFQKTLALNDFYLGAPDWPHPAGHIQMMGKSDADMLRAEAAGWHGLVADLLPDASLEMVARHALDFWLMSEDLPDPENRVTIDSQGGIVLAVRENNVEAHQRLIRALKQILHDLREPEHVLPRIAYFGQNIPIGGTAHQCGTVRFGRDPSSSALDINCKTHELDNLYVADASFFPSAGAMNPSLTIIANALRVGDHLLERLS